MRQAKFIFISMTMSFLAVVAKADFVQVQNDPIFKQHFEKPRANNPHVKSVLIPREFYHKEKLEKSLKGVPIYIVEHNSLQPLSHYQKCVEKFKYDFDMVSWVKDNFKRDKIKREQILNVTAVPTTKVSLGENACVFWIKGIISYVDNENKRHECIFFMQEIIQHSNGRFVAAAMVGLAESVEEMAMYEKYTEKLNNFFREKANTLPSCEDSYSGGKQSLDKQSSMAKGGTEKPETASGQEKEDEEGEYYVTPPFGMLRGLATIVLSPFNYFRAFPATVNTAIERKADAGSGAFIFPFAVCFETFPVIGDILFGTLDIISFGTFGNAVYGKKYTPWLWERKNDTPVDFTK